MFTTAGFTFATTAGTPVLCGGWAWACCAMSSSAISVEASFDLMSPSIANLFIIVGGGGPMARGKARDQEMADGFGA